MIKLFVIVLGLVLILGTPAMTQETEQYLDKYVEGIKQAISLAPLQIQDSIPPDMTNWEIPPFLVRQIQNQNKAQGYKVGTKPTNKLLVFSLEITDREYRSLSDADSMINLLLNRSQDVFIHFEGAK